MDVQGSAISSRPIVQICFLIISYGFIRIDVKTESSVGAHDEARGPATRAEAALAEFGQMRHGQDSFARDSIPLITITIIFVGSSHKALYRICR